MGGWQHNGMSQISEARKQSRPLATPKESVRVGCWNTRTMFSVGKTAQIVKEARRYKLRAVMPVMLAKQSSIFQRVWRSILPVIGPLTFSNICKFWTLSHLVFSRLFPCFGSCLHQFSTSVKRGHLYLERTTLFE